MRLDTLHHIAVIGTDYKRSLTFYQKLGFQVVQDQKRPHDRKIDLRLGEIQLELFIKPAAPKRPSYPEAAGLRHVSFFAPDVKEAVAWLSSLGISCEPIRIDPDTQTEMTFFHDPDGLPWELHG